MFKGMIELIALIGRMLMGIAKFFYWLGRETFKAFKIAVRGAKGVFNILQLVKNGQYGKAAFNLAMMITAIGLFFALLYAFQLLIEFIAVFFEQLFP